MIITNYLALDFIHRYNFITANLLEMSIGRAYSYFTQKYYYLIHAQPTILDIIWVPLPPYGYFLYGFNPYKLLLMGVHIFIYFLSNTHNYKSGMDDVVRRKLGEKFNFNCLN